MESIILLIKSNERNWRLFFKSKKRLFKIFKKGKNLLTLYQYHTKVAEHYFCSKCGIYTHTNPRSNHDKVYMINIACIEGVNPFEYKNIGVNDGVNHPLDKK